MNSTALPNSFPSLFGLPTSSGLFWLLFVAVFFGLHIVSYFLYRIAAYYCKWNKSEKTIHQHFQDVVFFVVLTFVYVLAANYWDMFNCPIDHLILEYIIPFLISLFLAGFICEVSYFRVSLVQMKSWEMKTWIMFSCLLCILLFLTIITFIYCQQKDLFFLPILGCVIYFLGGLVVSLIARHPSLRFHPRSYQLAFSLCLLRKDNNFYSRLFAAICTGIFVRCVAANHMLSLLEPVEDDSIQSLPVQNSPEPITNTENVAVNIPDGTELNQPLLEEEEEELMLETIEKYNRGEIDEVVIQTPKNNMEQQIINETILEEDEKNHSVLHMSRSSDYGDWNEQQRKELYGDYD